MARNATIIKRMNNIVSFLLVVLIIASIITVPLIFNTSCNGDCFRNKYETDSTIATFIEYEMRGRNTTAKYQFKVNGRYFYVNTNLTKDAEQIGDKFEILFDVNEPNNNYLLFERPIIPSDIIESEGHIVKYSVFEKSNRIEVLFSYTVEGYNLQRVQYFNLENLSLIENWHRDRVTVLIDVVRQNARRAYLNIEKTIARMKSNKF